MSRIVSIALALAVASTAAAQGSAVKSAALNDPVLAGVGVRVGVNAVRLAYPAPSGVVNYRLRQAGPRNELRLGAGLRDFGTRVVQGDGSFRDGDFSLAGGLVWRPLLRLTGGSEGRAVEIGRAHV